MQFVSTLHATTKGMKYWYTRGLGAKTGVPYEQLFCVKCHLRKLPSGAVIKGCETCHAEVENGKVVDFSVKVADRSETCLACHGREAKAIMLGEKGLVPEDVHMLGMGFTCSNCHDSKEVHAMGDYNTMSEALRRDCKDCHMNGYAPYPLQRHTRAPQAPRRPPLHCLPRTHRHHVLQLPLRHSLQELHNAPQGN